VASINALVFVAVLLLCAVPLGHFIKRVFDGALLAR